MDKRVDNHVENSSRTGNKKVNVKNIFRSLVKGVNGNNEVLPGEHSNFSIHFLRMGNSYMFLCSIQTI